MSVYFPSRYAPAIWDQLYRVMIPEHANLDIDYVKTRGVYITGDRQMDKILKGVKKQVMIPIVRIVEYYNEGVPVEIIDRKDMIEIHKNIEGYLQEWREQLQYTLNMGNKIPKEFLLSLERVSKIIYNKAKATEVNENIISGLNFGLKSSLNEIENKEKVADLPKPDYEGITDLVKTKTRLSRY